LLVDIVITFTRLKHETGMNILEDRFFSHTSQEDHVT